MELNDMEAMPAGSKSVLPEDLVVGELSTPTGNLARYAWAQYLEVLVDVSVSKKS